ncbi:MAG: hypothetical protein Q9165_005945, partial [Trypethelium subeluteriae]
THTEINREVWEVIEYDDQAEDTRRVKVEIPFSNTLRQNAEMFKCQPVEERLRETKEKLDETNKRLDETMEKLERKNDAIHEILRSRLQREFDNLAIKFAKMIMRKVGRKRCSDLTESERTDDDNHSTNDLVRQVQPFAANPRRLVELDIEGIQEGHAELLKDLSEIMIRRNKKSYDEFGELASILRTPGRAEDGEIRF